MVSTFRLACSSHHQETVGSALVLMQRFVYLTLEVGWLGLLEDGVGDRGKKTELKEHIGSAELVFDKRL